MDEITDSIGKLSTNATEWQPGHSYTPSGNTATTTITEISSQNEEYYQEEYINTFSSTEQSDLKWTSKEFVPQWSQQQQNQEEQELQPNADMQPWSNSMNHPLSSSTQVSYTETSDYAQEEQETQQVSSYYAQEEENQQVPSASNTDAHDSSNNLTSTTSIPASQSQPPPGSSTFTSNNNTQQANHHSHHVITPPSRRTLRSSMGLPNHILWILYRNMAHEMAQELEPNDSRYKAIPPAFTNAMPLDPMEYMNITSSNKVVNVAVAGHSSKKHSSVDATTSLKRSSFGYPTTVFKVMSRDDGWLYCLRRFDSVKCVNQKIASVVLDKWTRATTRARTSPGTRGKHVMEHPGLVRLYQCFYIPQNRAVFFVHHYYPMACTLRDYLHGIMGRNNTNVPPIDPRNAQPFAPLEESTIWSYVVQLVSAVRAVHQGNLACQTLQLSHILVTPEVGSGADPSMMMHLSNAATQWMSAIRTNRVRLRINCIGVSDALEFEARKDVKVLQREDMTCLGRIMISLASGIEIISETDLDTVGRCEAYIRNHYSPKFCNLAMALILDHGRSLAIATRSGMVPPSIEEVSREILDYIWEEMDCAHAITDNLDEVLASEFESSRALRLLLKMGFINERPEFMIDTRWSETGSNYALKLFRDYVFHQCDESGRPVMDLGHVVTALNKLDAAEEEKIVLASRDGVTVMVVTFAEIAQALEKAYEELCSSSVTPSALHHGPEHMGY